MRPGTTPGSTPGCGRSTSAAGPGAPSRTWHVPNRTSWPQWRAVRTCVAAVGRHSPRRVTGWWPRSRTWRPRTRTARSSWSSRTAVRSGSQQPPPWACRVLATTGSARRTTARSPASPGGRPACSPTTARPTPPQQAAVTDRRPMALTTTTFVAQTHNLWGDHVADQRREPLEALYRKRQPDLLATQEQRPWSRDVRSEEHTSELQSRFDLVCRLLLEKKKQRSEKRT